MSKNQSNEIIYCDKQTGSYGRLKVTMNGNTNPFKIYSHFRNLRLYNTLCRSRTSINEI